MGNAASQARIEDREVGVEPSGDIIRRENRNPGGISQTVGPHQEQIGVGDREDAGRAKRSS